MGAPNAPTLEARAGRTDTLPAALDYAGRGWLVLPLHSIQPDRVCTCMKVKCGSAGKHPRTNEGLAEASADPGVIAGWWEKWSAANVGIRTGPESGILAVDLDGQQGIDAWARLTERHGAPVTPTAATGGGGRHLFFRYPDGRKVGNKAGLKLDGERTKIDIRGVGGYVVAAPSLHRSGSVYAWEVAPDDAPLAAAPAWLLDLIDPPRVPVTPPAPSPDDRTGALERARLYLAKMPAAVSGQGGHNALMAAARVVVRGFALGPERGLELLLAEYNPRCSPPWTEKELEHKCRDAWEKPFDHPRGYLLDAERDLGPKAPARAGSASAPAGGFRPLTVRDWPEPIDPAAFHGPAGAYALAVDPYTEADPVGVLLQTRVGFGVMAGRNAYACAEADRHYPNEYVLLVGETATGKKGTSWGHARALLARADPGLMCDCLKTGASSGEGITFQVRDKREPRGNDAADPGCADKRLLLDEPEFAAVLKVNERQGNTLSPVLRNGWDGRPLGTLTKTNALKATGHHIGLVAHITPAELGRYLTATETANGLGNRILIAKVKRSKRIPRGKGVPDEIVARFAAEFAAAARFAATAGEVDFDADAGVMWDEAYEELTAERAGVVGELTARAPAHVLRLALIYALLDRSPAVRPPHLEASLAVWNYCLDSVRHQFGDATGDEVADRILTGLRECGPMTRTGVSGLLGRNVNKKRIAAALAVLSRSRLAESVTAVGNGPPVETWRAL